jgi:hypothetical protein
VTLTIGLFADTQGRPRRYRGSMTDKEPSSGRTWRYRFSLTDGEEIEIREFNSNEAAEDYARELSKARQTPVTIQYHDLVDWTYVTEVDQRH